MKYQLLTLLFFLISFQQVSAQCDECPQPVIEQIVNLGDGEYDLYWSVEQNACTIALVSRSYYTDCRGGISLSEITISADDPSPIRITIGGNSHGNDNGSMEFQLFTICRTNFSCQNSCPRSETSYENLVLTACDCDLFSTEYDCNQICFNIDAHEFDCVAFDVRLLDVTNQIVNNFPISSNGESFQLCVDRNPLDEYFISARVDADCDPETTLLPAMCPTYHILPCGDCPDFPAEEDLEFECDSSTGGFTLAVEGFRACPNYLPPSAAGSTVSVELCAWEAGTPGNCDEDGMCCETFQVSVPEACPQDCPEFPTAEDLEFECDSSTGGFTLAVEGFRVCPSWLPPSAAGTTVSVELCAWQAGTPGDCNEDGICCETFQVPVPEDCPQDCPEFPTAEDIEFECLPNEGGITLAAAGFRVCPSWLPSSTANSTVTVEFCAWEAGTPGNCNEDGMCCVTIQVLVPECEDCIPNADCSDFNQSWSEFEVGQYSRNYTFTSGVSATLDVNFIAGGIHDHIIITVNGTPVIDEIVGDAGDICPNTGQVFNDSFCVLPCDEINITIDAAVCFVPEYPTGWTLNLTCREGCTPGRSTPSKPKGITTRSSDAAESNFLKPVELTVFPNPVTDILNITTSDPMIEYRTASVIHSSGKMIHTENISTIDNLQIDASTYPQGLYILELIDNNGNRVAKRFMKID